MLSYILTLIKLKCMKKLVMLKTIPLTKSRLKVCNPVS